VEVHLFIEVDQQTTELARVGEVFVIPAWLADAQQIGVRLCALARWRISAGFRNMRSDTDWVVGTAHGRYIHRLISQEDIKRREGRFGMSASSSIVRAYAGASLVLYDNGHAPKSHSSGAQPN